MRLLITGTWELVILYRELLSCHEGAGDGEEGAVIINQAFPWDAVIMNNSVATVLPYTL